MMKEKKSLSLVVQWTTSELHKMFHNKNEFEDMRHTELTVKIGDMEGGAERHQGKDEICAGSCSILQPKHYRDHRTGTR